MIINDTKKKEERLISALIDPIKIDMPCNNHQTNQLTNLPA